MIKELLDKMYYARWVAINNIEIECPHYEDSDEGIRQRGVDDASLENEKLLISLIDDWILTIIK